MILRSDAGKVLVSGELLGARLAGDVDGEKKLPCEVDDGERRPGEIRPGDGGILGEVATSMALAALDLDISDKES